MKFIVALSLLLAVASAAPKRLVVPVKDAHVGKSRIISGSPADPGQYPFQVLDAYELILGTSYCGGALISSRWVLTAAHCAAGAYSHTVTLGTIYFNGDDPNAVVVHTTSHILHENYDSLYLWNDVALVDFVSDVQFTDYIQPISLGSRVVESNAPVWVSGWGKTSDPSNWLSPVLNVVNLNTISNEDCADIYGNIIVDGTLCCRGHPEHSTCDGDSGGPLFEYDSEEKPHHIGIVSFVHHIEGCYYGYPSGYVRTSSQISWIESHTGPL